MLARARRAKRVKTYWKKDVYERCLQSLKSRKFESSSEGTQPKRPRWVYCILYNISRRGLTRVAYLDEGAMREPETWDKREVVTPTSLHLT